MSDYTALVARLEAAADLLDLGGVPGGVGRKELAAMFREAIAALAPPADSAAAITKREQLSDPSKTIQATRLHVSDDHNRAVADALEEGRRAAAAPACVCWLGDKSALLGPSECAVHGWHGAAAAPAQEGLSDAVLLDFWRSVQGPRAELTGPLIRYAALVFAAARRVQEKL